MRISVGVVAGGIVAGLLGGCAKGEGAERRGAGVSAESATGTSTPTPTPTPIATANTTSTSTLPTTASATPTPADPAPDAGADDSRKGTYVLHFGDSFTDASFKQNLYPHFKAVGARYVVTAKTSSYTTTWASDPELDKLLWNKPQLVLITLGANEVDMTVPNEHAGAIRSLAKKASRYGACVWIAPPMWKATKFLDVIKENCAPCLYFDSDAHVPDIERQRDKIHPNAVGGAKWAEGFWQWLEARRDPTQGAWALKPED